MRRQTRNASARTASRRRRAFDSRRAANGVAGLFCGVVTHGAEKGLVGQAHRARMQSERSAMAGLRGKRKGAAGMASVSRVSPEPGSVIATLRVSGSPIPFSMKFRKPRSCGQDPPSARDNSRRRQLGQDRRFVPRYSCCQDALLTLRCPARWPLDPGTEFATSVNVGWGPDTANWGGGILAFRTAWR